MLNNLTNFLNIITSKMIKKVPEANDLIPLGTRDSRYGGKYKPTGITVADFINSIPVPPLGVQSVVAGTNVTVNNIDPLNPIVNSLPDGVQSIVAGTNVTINNTDPANPIVSATSSSGGGIHALVKPTTGRRVILSVVAGANTGSQFTVNRLVLTPFIPANTFTISEILMNVNIGVAGSLCRLLIYSDNNGVPNAKLYESTNLNLATDGFKIASTTFTFNAGTTYWLGFHGGATTANIIQIQPASLYAIANNAVTFTDTQTIFYVTATLGSAPANITSPTAAFGNTPWIALTPA